MLAARRLLRARFCDWFFDPRKCRTLEARSRPTWPPHGPAKFGRLQVVDPRGPSSRNGDTGRI